MEVFINYVVLTVKSAEERNVMVFLGWNLVKFIFFRNLPKE